jgi:hypothetical protein
MNSELELAEELGRKGQHVGAELIWKDYVANEAPDDPAALFNIGLMIEQQTLHPWRMVEAASFYERVICAPGATMAQRSDALQNFGVLMHRAGRTDKACIALNMALQIDPDNNAARLNFAETLRQVGKFEEADAEYEHVLRLNENDPGAHFSRGMIALSLGEYARGWADYEWRFQVPDFPSRPLKSIFPGWQGEALDDKAIVLSMEQGMGDAIMGIRYARVIKAKWPTATVWFYGHVLLQDLMLGAGVDGVFYEADEGGRMIRDGEPFEYHYHIPILSLPHRFGTTLATVPAEVPYIVAREDWPEVPSITPWKKIRGMMRPDTGRRQIGLVWAGSRHHGRDKWRSLEPELFQPIIDAHPECQFYSLQLGPREKEVSRLRGVLDLAPAIHAAGDSWAATAQAVRQLDAVVCCDTAVAHLAGALGVPVFVAIPFSPDFRWGLSGETTPWYPTMRLFRQPTADDWSPVIQRINGELRTL